MIEAKLNAHVELLIERYPKLKCVRQEVIAAYAIMEDCYLNGGKLLIAGNGGSAADAEHIAGELMKRFKAPRPVSPEFADKLKKIDHVRGVELAKNLECALCAIPLVSHEAMTTAYINDVENVLDATVVARAMGIKVVGLTGAKGGELASVADVAVKVPETETYVIQELHLPVYHCWCLMLEDRFFVLNKGD